MIIHDPVTGEALTVYCEDIAEGEIYRANAEKCIQSTMRDNNVDRTEAIRMISNSDIANPVRVKGANIWVE